MAIGSHIDTFAGLPVVAFLPEQPPAARPAAAAWRIDTDYEGGAELFNQRLDAFLATDWVGEVRALIIGEWGESYDTGAPIERLVAAAGTLTGLRALFLGEMTYEEQEISWINQ